MKITKNTYPNGTIEVFFDSIDAGMGFAASSIYFTIKEGKITDSNLNPNGGLYKELAPKALRA